MKIKVCGMRDPQNMEALAKLPIDYIGLIFYDKSPRFVSDLDANLLPDNIDRVGVFVDANFDYIKEMIAKYKLSMVQLHGKESPEFCVKINEVLKTPVIKAFSIADADDLEKTKAYEWIWGYFLFDTKSPLRGGSGMKFDWSILNTYSDDTLFFLSGGISAEDVELIKKLSHPKLYALDLNSKFEIEAGLKDIKLLDRFIKQIKE